DRGPYRGNGAVSECEVRADKGAVDVQREKTDGKYRCGHPQAAGAGVRATCATRGWSARSGSMRHHQPGRIVATRDRMSSAWSEPISIKASPSGASASGSRVSSW